MLRSLELGRAGTEEWIAASQNLKLSDESFSGFIYQTGDAIVGFVRSRSDEVSDQEKAQAPSTSSIR